MAQLISLPTPLPSELPRTGFKYSGREDLQNLKRLIWLYLILLLVEGALRKWVLPSMANPLLVIRDPVILVIYIMAGVIGIFPRNSFVTWIIILGALSVVVSELAGQGNLAITIYGLRTNFLHLPLIFLIPLVFDEEDVHRVGKFMLIAAIPMAMLVLLQFKAGPDSKLNVGAGGSIGGQMEVGMGKIRPAGTFSFNTGIVDFVAIVAAYLLSVQMAKQPQNRKLSLAALPALLTIVAVSGSRSSLGVVTVILIGLVFICLRKPVFFGQGMKGLGVLAVAYFALSFWGEFKTGLMVHENRLETGGGVQEGMLMRIVNEMFMPFRVMTEVPICGKGLGMGTNVAAGLLFGERGFLLAESEWERVVKESGPILGFAYIVLRLSLLGYVGMQALKALDRENPLPMLLFCGVAPELFSGQFAVPTTLGFAVFTSGLCLAATNLPMSTILPIEVLPPAEPSTPTVRGRSRYAEYLHGS